MPYSVFSFIAFGAAVILAIISGDPVGDISAYVAAIAFELVIISFQLADKRERE